MGSAIHRESQTHFLSPFAHFFPFFRPDFPISSPLLPNHLTHNLLERLGRPNLCLAERPVENLGQNPRTVCVLPREPDLGVTAALFSRQPDRLPQHVAAYPFTPVPQPGRPGANDALAAAEVI